MHEGSLQVLALQESIDMLEEIDYDDLKEDLRLQLNQMAQMQWMMVQMGQSGTLACTVKFRRFPVASVKGLPGNAHPARFAARTNSRAAALV